MKPLYRGEKHIGDLDEENRVFTKRVKRSKHWVYTLDAWGIDSEHLNNSLPAGTAILIEDTENQILYSTTKEEFIEKGKYLHFKEEKIDHGTQLFLPLKEFKQEKTVRKEPAYEVRWVKDGDGYKEIRLYKSKP